MDCWVLTFNFKIKQTQLNVPQKHYFTPHFVSYCGSFPFLSDSDKFSPLSSLPFKNSKISVPLPCQIVSQSVQASNYITYLYGVYKGSKVQNIPNFINIQTKFSSGTCFSKILTYWKRVYCKSEMKVFSTFIYFIVPIVNDLSLGVVIE